MRYLTWMSMMIWNIGVMWAQPTADLQYDVYYTDEDVPYAEFSISILTQSLHQPADSSMPKSAVATFLIRQGDNILEAERWRLNAPIQEDKDFYYRHRTQLAPGDYDVEVVLKDGALLGQSEESKLTKSLVVTPPVGEVFMSSLSLLSSVQPDDDLDEQSKHGLRMEPLKFDFLHGQRGGIEAFFEVYHSDRLGTQAYDIAYYVIALTASSADTVCTLMKKRRVVPVDPVLFSLPVQPTWRSGKYRLTTAILSQDGDLLASQDAPFVLSNPAFEEKELTEEDILKRTFVGALTEEELDYSLSALSARVNPQDVNLLDNLIQEGDLMAKRRFLYGYWRQFASISPQISYEEYMLRVRQIDKMFYDGLGHGFESDRGYIMLKYGQPDHRVVVEDEPTAPPYEIWTYNEFPATNQNNVRFVYYSPFGNSYELLHSTARGELNDPQWLVKLYSATPEDVIGNTIDARDVGDHVNRRAAQLFNDN